MCTDETTTYESPDESTGGTYEAPDDGAPGGTPGWSRRTFLKAAALGTAAAALVNVGGKGGLNFGPLSALAHDISSFQCTANDVRINGPGRILNEPCNCPPGSTFTAQVEFSVTNNAASARNCITLHLCPVTINGQVFNPGDVKLQGTVGGKQTSPMIALIENYPCNAGLVCFGSQPAAGQGEVFAKGEDCPTGQCCGTITWRVPGQDPDCDIDVKLIGSKCRHQQICIQGRSVDLACVDDPNDPNDTCSPTCGGTSTLVLSGTGATPLSFSLTDDNGNTYSPVSTTAGSATYKVTVSETTTFTGTITDATGCANTDTHTLTVTPITATLSATAPQCAGGQTTITATATGGGLISYQFFADGNPLGTVQSSTGSATLTPVLSSGPHSLSVTATNAGGCPAVATTSVDVPTPVTADLSLSGNQPCSGVLTFNAAVSGGTAPYTITFSVDGVDQQSGAGTSFSYGPVLDGACHEIKVRAVDSNQCPSSPSTPGADTIDVSQCVTTTVCS